MKINDTNRPKDITSDAIWEVYRRLCEMEKRYVVYYTRRVCRVYPEIFLCYVAKIEIGADETEYDDRDPSGITMPVRKLEWISLRLVSMENGKLSYWDTRISENVLYCQNHSAEDIIKNSKISFPTTEELMTAEYVEACMDGGEIALIPSIHYEVFRF